MKKIFSRNPLFFSFLFPAVIDGIVTLLGQDERYWNNFKFANEASPAYFALSTHPAVFILGAAIWFILLYQVFMKLNKSWSLSLAIGFIAGHSWGSSTWITKLLVLYGILPNYDRTSIILRWTILIIYFFIIGVIAKTSILEYLKRDKDLR